MTDACDIYKSGDNLKSGFYTDDSYASGLKPWFLVSGDTDDFIFYDEPDRTHSEK